MWNMLRYHCPDLCGLTIDLPRGCHHNFSIGPLIRCRWPKLHTLIIGVFGTNMLNMLWPPVKAFADARGHLVSSRFPAQLPFLRHLRLTSRGETASSFNLNNLFCDSQALPSLTSLSIWFTCRVEYDSIRNVSDVFKSCSQISHLELLTCLSVLSFVSSSDFKISKFPPIDIRNTTWRRFTIFHC